MESSRRDIVVQRLSHLRTHDASNFKHDVFINLDKFPELDAKVNDLIQIVGLVEVSKSKATIAKQSRGPDGGDPSASDANVANLDVKHQWEHRRGSPVTLVTVDENGRKLAFSRKADYSRMYVFRIREPAEDQKKALEGIALSLNSTIANVFGLKNRNQVLVSIAEEASHAVSHVEVAFRDQYLSRADMWRLVISELSQKTVYKDQKITFLDSIKAVVKNVYQGGEKRKTGYFGTSTKPIFRSESARFTILIQMSKEMWEFDVTGGGELNFNKVIGGFLPELFKNWSTISAHHLVSIVLFARIEYDNNSITNSSSSTHKDKPLQVGTRDFYRVVASDVSTGDWNALLQQLKREFKTFLRDISIQRSDAVCDRLTSLGDDDSEPPYIIVGTPSSAIRGNILEALNLASSHFSQDYIDRDLVRTGISVVLITAGSGVFEVNYNLLKSTTELLVASGMGVDLVCLGPVPLHSVPLFKYSKSRSTKSTPMISHASRLSSENVPRQKDDLLSRDGASMAKASNHDEDSFGAEWNFAMPHWVDVSFWAGDTDQLALKSIVHKPRSKNPNNHQIIDRPFNARCVLYELEMMGYMENEMINIAIPNMYEDALHPWHKSRNNISAKSTTELDRPDIQRLEREWMDNYDDVIFQPTHERFSTEGAAEASLKDEPIRREAPASKVEHIPDPHINHKNHTSEIPLVSQSSSKTIDAENYSIHSPKSQQAPSLIKSLTSDSRRTSSPSSRGGLTTPKLTNRQVLYYKSSPSQEVSADVASVKAVVSPSQEKRSPQSESGHLSQLRSILAKSKLKSTSKVTTKAVISVEGLSSVSRAFWQGQRGTADSNIPYSFGGSSKPIAIATGRATRTRSSSRDVGSAETIHGTRNDTKKISLSKSIRKDEPGAILYVASNTRRIGLKPGLSTSPEGSRLSPTLSSRHSMAPWLVLVNPCNPRKNNHSVNSQFRRWKHVFPKELKTSSMKWKSLSSPASVPITNDFFPSPPQLIDEYHQHPYNISRNMDMEVTEESRCNQSLLRELIAFRLSHGFQLVVGSTVAECLGNHGPDLADVFDKSYMTRDGATVFMSLGSSIHQLQCLPNEEVEIRCFNRKPCSEVEDANGNIVEYRPYIRSASAKSYVARPIPLARSMASHNWNVIDNFLAGHDDDFSDSLRYWRARFVFIPVEVTSANRKTLNLTEEDSEEEIRLEGIRKLTVLWQRHSVVEMQSPHSTRRRQNRNPLMIDYQTRDPSAVVAAGPEGLLMTESNANACISPEVEMYSTDNIDLRKLAQDIQSEQGIKMTDRRWHFKLYVNCFVGSGLVTWLFERFRDIDIREDAVDFGNELMSKGLFQHVTKRHLFRDGYYYFQMTPEYRLCRIDGKNWFSRKEKGMVLPAGSADWSKAVPGIEATELKLTSSNSSQTDEEKQSSLDPWHRRKVTLSYVMKLNVDVKKQSYRPEIINLHYGRLHSPDNCYHIRIDWMNVTSKFIEDSISQWANHARKYGLSLVEVPIAEASSISDIHAFRGCYRIKLAIPPRPDDYRQMLGTNGITSKDFSDKLLVHKSILRKLGFVLDIESHSSFPADIEVSYSWGKTEYRYTQFIHKSGTTLAQITDEGDFLLLANRLFDGHNSAIRDSAKNEAESKQVTERRQAFVSSPIASPAIRATADVSIESDRSAKLFSAEEVKDEVEAFCHDAEALQVFYSNLFRLVGCASPSTGMMMVDQSVPWLRLPPRIASLKEGSLPSSLLATANT